MRLQKFLARAGVASRRGSEDLMTAGRVTVNGVVVDQLGSKLDPKVDEVCVDGKLVTLADAPEYLMLHKPVGYLTTMSDPQGRPTVAELLPEEHAAGLFPVGRLDYDTSGLLLFMTDGELAYKLLHPKHHVSKRYKAVVEGAFTEEVADKLRAGVALHDGTTKPAEVEIITRGDGSRGLSAGARGDGSRGLSAENTHNENTPSSLLNMTAEQPAQPARTVPTGYAELMHKKKLNTNERIKLASGELPLVTTEVAITISEGRKRQVKRMFALVGYPVLQLHREAFGPLELGNLPAGHCRSLTEAEITALKNAAQL